MLRKKIKELAAILEEEGLGEIEVRTWWRTIRVARKPSEEPLRDEAAAAPPAAAAAPAPTVTPGPAAAPEPQTASAPGPQPAGGGAVSDDDGLTEILSPMVGTFYASPNPQSDPFVSPGTRVETGQVICIIEAMKLMNEIEAETGGVIRKVLAKDAQPVEFGQPLFLIESA